MHVQPQKKWYLSESQQKQLQELKQTISLLKTHRNSMKEPWEDQSLTMGNVVKSVDENLSMSLHWVRTLDNIYQSTSFADAIVELGTLSRHTGNNQIHIKGDPKKDLLVRLGVFKLDAPQETVLPQEEAIESMSAADQVEDMSEDISEGVDEDVNQIATTVVSEGVSEDASEDLSKDLDDVTPSLDHLQSLTADDAVLEPLELGQVADVPKLSFDLSRVLFNPGVYQLQDPRSRVYNFDPYLQKIMPVGEFNFDALNPYITSSEDNTLQKLAAQHGKRYIASSSSMSAALQHFHFLLSSWRTLNVDSLSKGFRPETLNFTRIHRSPSAIFLRWKDGVYGVDADKEFDSANVLMSLGHTMEKLFTLEKEEFEQYRKSSARSQQEYKPKPEQYHYGGLAKFLLRSQLDAHDPRLPGTGMFDLKTRAVVAVRMMLSEYEKGLGYQIKEKQGKWESYEREYYDMMRSAFLKYSLQVRMGRMDGIFVAYHNVESIFGFQYISLPELDHALHGQTDGSLGDQEFAFSVKLLSEIFDQVTKKFPEQSVRFHFETRESAAKVREPIHRMYVFAEVMPEEEIATIQESNRQEIEILNHKLRNPELYPKPKSPEPESESGRQAPDELDEVMQNRPPTQPGKENAADISFLESLEDLAGVGSKNKPASKTAKSESTEPGNPILGFELVVRNVVNGQTVLRPEHMTAADDWTLKYTLNPMNDEKAQLKYKMCKLRRKSVLKEIGEAAMFNPYFDNLQKLSEEGAKWRRELDEMDAQRERVVLYEQPMDNEIMKAEAAS